MEGICRPLYVGVFFQGDSFDGSDELFNAVLRFGDDALGIEDRSGECGCPRVDFGGVTQNRQDYLGASHASVGAPYSRHDPGS